MFRFYALSIPLGLLATILTGCGDTPSPSPPQPTPAPGPPPQPSYGPSLGQCGDYVHVSEEDGLCGQFCEACPGGKEDCGELDDDLAQICHRIDDKCGTACRVVAECEQEVLNQNGTCSDYCSACPRSLKHVCEDYIHPGLKEQCESKSQKCDSECQHADCVNDIASIASEPTSQPPYTRDSCAPLCSKCSEADCDRMDEPLAGTCHNILGDGECGTECKKLDDCEQQVRSTECGDYCSVCKMDVFFGFVLFDPCKFISPDLTDQCHSEYYNKCSCSSMSTDALTDDKETVMRVV